MIVKAILLAIAVLNLVAPACAGVNKFYVLVGRESIDIPVPNGFSEVSDSYPAFYRVAESMTPPDNRLLAAFIPEDTVEKMTTDERMVVDKYILVQTHRKSETLAITSRDFEAITARIRQDQERLANSGSIATLVENSAQKLSEEFGRAIDIKYGQAVHFGIFAEDANYISSSNLVKFQISMNGATRQCLVANASNIARVKNRLIFVNVYSSYYSRSDLDWVQDLSKTVVGKIISANAFSEKTPDMGNPFSKIALGAVIFMTCVIIGVCLRRLKKPAQ